MLEVDYYCCTIIKLLMCSSLRFDSPWCQSGWTNLTSLKKLLLLLLLLLLESC